MKSYFVKKIGVSVALSVCLLGGISDVVYGMEEEPNSHKKRKPENPENSKSSKAKITEKKDEIEEAIPHIKGEGIPQDFEKASSLLQNVSFKDKFKAYITCVDYYSSPEHPQKNYQKAEFILDYILFNFGKSQNLDPSSLDTIVFRYEDLASYYIKGKGIPQNLEEGERLINRGVIYNIQPESKAFLGSLLVSQYTKKQNANQFIEKINSYLKLTTDNFEKSTSIHKGTFEGIQSCYVDLFQHFLEGKNGFEKNFGAAQEKIENFYTFCTKEKKLKDNVNLRDWFYNGFTRLALPYLIGKEINQDFDKSKKLLKQAFQARKMKPEEIEKYFKSLAFEFVEGNLFVGKPNYDIARQLATWADDLQLNSSSVLVKINEVIKEYEESEED